MSDTTVIDTESQRKIYIASRGSSAMTLENIVEKSEANSKLAFLKAFLVGTDKDVQRLEKTSPAVWHDVETGNFLETVAGMGLYALSGYSYLLDRTLTLPTEITFCAGLYLIVDTAMRMRRRKGEGYYETYHAAGIAGSIIGAVKKE